MIDRSLLSPFLIAIAAYCAAIGLVMTFPMEQRQPDSSLPTGTTGGGSR